jgi:pentatricopeptide repeat protein
MSLFISVVTFVGVLNACAMCSCMKRADVLMSRSFKVDGIWMSLWEIAWLTCMPNVGAWKMFREHSTRYHLKMQVTWNAVILGYVKHGQGPKALELFRQM